jgi:hypothetical protein
LGWRTENIQSKPGKVLEPYSVSQQPWRRLNTERNRPASSEDAFQFVRPEKRREK